MTIPILLARDGTVATLTLNRPASLNALDAAMMDALVEHTAALAADDALRCVVIRGAGRHFMAGGDIRHFAEQLAIAADSSYFTSAYRQLGLTPDGGLSYALPRQVGLKNAMEILLLGERFGAADALRLGLVNRVVPEAELDRATRAIVAAIVSGPVAAMRNGKR